MASTSCLAIVQGKQKPVLCAVFRVYGGRIQSFGSAPAVSLRSQQVEAPWMTASQVAAGGNTKHLYQDANRTELIMEKFEDVFVPINSLIVMHRMNWKKRQLVDEQSNEKRTLPAKTLGDYVNIHHNHHGMNYFNTLQPLFLFAMYRYLVRHFDYKFSLKKLRESKSTVHWITIAACFPPMAIAFSFGHLLPLFGSKQRAYYSRYRNQTNLYYRLLNQLRSPLTISHPGIPTVVSSSYHTRTRS
ncbi:hypothetical protein DFJ43DRAFT_508174 [Lentinula guzmanii]|uniref:Uncharacterized protein n=1 Tax=Lentinula guzmanii TaxID=2804957 RepID=A0AA38JCY3_9AGAR|nr:hypothetical protein DFJ43DRAFT_508174 [Lentinula guzmanii]